MASSREVLESWLNEGKTVPKDVVDSFINMNGLTDQLAEQRFLDRYGNIAPFKDADKIRNPTIPSIQNVIAILGIEDDPKKSKTIKNPRTKEQKFLDDFPKKSKEWKEIIEKDSKYGKRGWETVKEIWKQAMHQKMLSDIAKARKEAADNAGYVLPIVGDIGDIPLTTTLAKLMFPRATEHIANTGDFTGKDFWADLATNLAMSIPGAKFTGLAGKGLSKVAPQAVKYFSGAGRNMLEGAVKGTGRMAGNIFGNAVVPFASEGMDALIYDDNDEGMEHRADFSVGDALLGTAINQGVNRGLMRFGGPIVDRFSQGGLARGGMLKIRNALEQLGLPFAKKGDDFAQDVAERVANKNIAENGEATKEGIRFVTRGGDDIASGAQAKSALENAANAQSVLDAISKGEITFDPKRSQSITDDVWKSAVDKAKADASNELEVAKAQSRQANQMLDEFVNDGSVEADKMEEALVGHLMDKEQNVSDAADRLEKAMALEGTTSATPVENMFHYKNPEGVVFPSRETLYKVIDENPTELVNYAAWHGKGDGAVGNTTRILNTVNQAVPAWAVNKLGEEKHADMLLSQTPEIKKALYKNSEETHKAPAKRKASRDVLNVVNSTPELNERDQRYLNAIAANPDILKYGYDEDPNGFKIWLLERGNNLLQGTSAFRPTFNVE